MIAVSTEMMKKIAETVNSIADMAIRDCFEHLRSGLTGSFVTDLFVRDKLRRLNYSLSFFRGIGEFTDEQG
jgi:hypothetical protein